MEQRRFELRVASDGKLTGTAIQYGDIARLPWGRERFVSGCFYNLDRDLKLNRQHDRNILLARVSAGNLRLIDSPDALRVEAELLDTREAQDTMLMVKRGLLRGYSIEFRADQKDWDGDLCTIMRAELGGLAVVDDPAYPKSYVEIRAAQVRRSTHVMPPVPSWL